MLPTAITSVTIRPATGWDIRPIASVLTTAAVTVAQWTSPGLVGRALLLYDDVLDQTRHAVRNGTALVAENDDETIGALVWSTCPPQEADIGNANPGGLNDAPACLLRRRHDTLEQSHWDLRGLGVLPGHWRRHVDEALLTTWHQKPGSIAVARAAVAFPGYGSLFADHGYQFSGTIRPTGWEDGPVMQRLWRPALARTTVHSRNRAADDHPGRRCSQQTAVPDSDSAIAVASPDWRRGPCPPR